MCAERIVKVICQDCGEEFAAAASNLMGVPIPVRKCCDRCATERIFREHQAVEELRQAEIARTRRRFRETCGIPPIFQAAEFGTFERERQARAYDRCREYAQGFDLVKPQGYNSLVMFSERAWGVGKSHLACAIINHILNNWGGYPVTRPALFVSEPDLFRRIQATYNVPREDRDWRETEDDVMRELTTVPLLVIDDLGKEERSDPRFVQRTLFAIINGRYNNLLPIVLTANLGEHGLQRYLGAGRENEASFDRLVAMTKGEFISMTGKSYRRKA
ncbi:MAG: ATP-binding protein [Dehalococcoidales bacterium]|nr:ATP-binding protein [Dehalococcoidales bacterium]